MNLKLRVGQMLSMLTIYLVLCLAYALEGDTLLITEKCSGAAIAIKNATYSPSSNQLSILLSNVGSKTLEGFTIKINGYNGEEMTKTYSKLKIDVNETKKIVFNPPFIPVNVMIGSIECSNVKVSSKIEIELPEWFYEKISGGIFSGKKKPFTEAPKRKIGIETENSTKNVSIFISSSWSLVSLPLHNFT